jgi:formylglycine-generating enzyme required for sulfatase activity
MSAEELRLAITEPAKRAGQCIDEATVGRLIDESLGREGVLPLLQFVLSAIWQGLASGIPAAETVNKLGGVGGALASHAEELYTALPKHDQQIARRAFLGMVQLGEGAQDTRRRVPIAKLVASDNPQHVLEVLNRFAKPERRLVTLSAEGETPLAEVTHEALLSHWGTLQRWLREGRDDVRFQRRLEEAADEWQAQNRPPGLLWRPPRLSLLQDYHREHQGDMRPEDLAFFEASQQEEQRRLDQEKKRKRQQWGTALGVTLLLCGLAIWQYLALESERARRRAILPEMVVIEPTPFDMGSPDSDDEAYGTERPQHPVSIASRFAIGKYEVTFEEYDKFAYDTNRRPPSDSGFGGERRPVINVSWHDAVAYAEWLSKKTGRRFRLPSEAEWEFAARAGTSFRRFWGDASSDACEYASVFDRGSEARVKARYNITWEPHDCDDGVETTSGVGHFRANQLGLHDMLGNVFEWVQDCWHDSYEEAPADGSGWFEVNNGDCGRRVLRGGSWLHAPRFVRSATRFRYTADYRNFDVGFRLAQDIN